MLKSTLLTITTIFIIIFGVACNNSESNEKTTATNNTGTNEITSTNTVLTENDNANTIEEDELEEDELEEDELEEDNDLVTRQFLDGKLTMLIPLDFEEMSKELLEIKYPTAQRPNLVLTNAKNTVNIAISHTPNPLKPEELSEALVGIETVFKNAFPSAEWFRKEIVSINNKDWFLLDVRTPAPNTPIRNIMAGTSWDGQMLMVTFNTTRDLEDEWLDKGNRIINSIELND